MIGREKDRLPRVLALLLALLMLSGCGGAAVDSSGTTDPAPNAEVPTEETIPPTVPEDGNPEDVTCKGSYTVTDALLADEGEKVIASVGDIDLTNRELQIYYWLEVSQWLRDNPDVTFSQGLDTLMCRMDDTLTWQQYFLQRALNTWHGYASLVQMSHTEGTPTEAAYQPIESFHEANLNEDMPALRYAYGYANADYAPNDLHQAYLDDLPQLLEGLAVSAGYADVDGLVADLAGAGGDCAALEGYADLFNRAYMYFTERTYYMEPSQEDVTQYLADHPALSEEAGQEDVLVDFRHILFVPENAVVAADGTATALEEGWEAAYDAAYSLYVKSQYKSFSEDTFAEWANANSADEGSRLNGGLYSSISQGQLVEALDDWLFDPERRHGDMAILRTDCGYHLVYFSGTTNAANAAAQAALTAQMGDELMIYAMETYSMTVDYGAICLGLAPQAGNLLDPDGVLYPDIAHERYPSAPQFFQQDYPHTYYGQYPIASWGCGITTMAMLSSYMTDEEWTPPELCAIYGYYNTEKGTNIVMYDDVPAEMGFYLEKRTWDWNEVVAALENGQVVACLQYAGYWTKGGHFLLLQRVWEDGLIEVRDSNLFNFGTLSGHQINAHDPSVITPKAAYYWIYQKKITRIPACWRCDDTGHEDVALAIFTGDYCCPKCTAALARRSSFLSACALAKVN